MELASKFDGDKMEKKFISTESTKYEQREIYNDFDEVDFDSFGKDDEATGENLQGDFSLLNKTIGKGVHEEMDSLEEMESEKSISHEESMLMLDELKNILIAQDKLNNSVKVPQVTKMDKGIQVEMINELEKKKYSWKSILKRI